MSTGIALGVRGELWETAVELHWVHTETCDRGVLFIKGEAINLTQQLHDILGVEHATSHEDWRLTPDFRVDFLKPKKGNGFMLGTEMGPFRFEYVSGGLDNGHDGKALFLRMNIAELLAAIPGFERDWVSGQIELGLIKGNTFKVLHNSELEFEPVSEGLSISANLEIGGNQICLEPPTNSTNSEPDASEKAVVDKNAPKALEVDKSMGPVHLHQITCQLANKNLVVRLNADFSMGPITLSFLGLGAEIDLFKISKDPWGAIDFKLYGLGLSYQKGPLRIAGIFEKDPKKEAYSGGILIKTKKFAITGFGAYSNEGDYKSIFGFACLNANIGGSPSFFVTGISFCFGYNRQIIVPPINEITDFPLVKYALDTSKAPQFEKGDGRNPLVAFNQKLGPYIPPKKGHFFFGVGVKFNTYKLMDTVALLILSAGDDLEFNLVGLSRIALPPNGLGTPLVFIEIALRASYSVNKGLLQVEGQLTKQSYLFSQAVKLTGGFAFYTWFKDLGTAKAGDFVLSVGGYHPQFKVPVHYPQVPRLGFEWRVGSSLLVSGKMYLALTPSAIMAGAAFNAVWKSGGFSAEFAFAADFLMQWKPFKYDARIAINARVGFTIDKWWITKTFSLEIGANLHIWGPEFSGEAELHARVCGIGVSFSVSFGAGGHQKSRLNWDEFKSSFLPENAFGNEMKRKSIIDAQIASGLMKELENNKNTEEKLALVNPKEFGLSINTPVPFTEIVINEQKPSLETIQQSYCLPTTGDSGVTSVLKITLKRNDQEIEKLDELEIGLVRKQMPRAVWNDRVEVNHLAADQTLEMIGGVTIAAKKDLFEQGTAPLPADQFAFSESSKYVEKSHGAGNEKRYADFFILPEIYSTEEFPQISDRDVEEYENYYGDQTEKTNINKTINPDL